MAAERSAVLFDWGGVMTGDLFARSAPSARARASTPTGCATLFRHDRDARALLDRLRVRAHRGGRVRAAPRRGARRRLARRASSTASSPAPRPTRRWSTACARCARRGVRTGLVSNSWGTRALPARPAGRALRRRRHLRRGGLPQARRAHVRAGRGAHRRCRRPRACSSTTWPSTSTRRASSAWPSCTTRRPRARSPSSSGWWARRPRSARGAARR